MEDIMEFNDFLNYQIRNNMADDGDKVIVDSRDNDFFRDMSILASACDTMFNGGEIDKSKRDIWNLLVEMLMDTIGRGLQNGEYNILGVKLIPDTIIMGILRDRGVEMANVSDRNIYEMLTNLSKTYIDIGKVNKR